MVITALFPLEPWSLPIESSDVQTILGVLLLQANSKGKKKVSTLTPLEGLGSGRTHETEAELRMETGDAAPFPLARPRPPLSAWSSCRALSASSQAVFNSEWDDFLMSLCWKCARLKKGHDLCDIVYYLTWRRVSMARWTYIFGHFRNGNLLSPH